MGLSNPWISQSYGKSGRETWIPRAIKGEVTLPETNIAHENPPFWWYLSGKMGIFMGYVSSREGYQNYHLLWGSTWIPPPQRSSYSHCYKGLGWDSPTKNVWKSWKGDWHPGWGVDLRDNCLKNSLPVSEKKTTCVLSGGRPSHQGFATDLFSACISLKTKLPYNTAIYNCHPKLVGGFSPTHLKNIKYARQIGSFHHSFGVKKNIWVATI